MLFADDTVLVDETQVGVNCKSELWRNALKYKVFRLSRAKTEYSECDFGKIKNRNEGGAKIEDHEVSKCDHLWNSGLIIHEKGVIKENVIHRIKVGWMK